MAGIISEKTKELLNFAAVTTIVRGNVGWTIVDCIVLEHVLQQSPERQSDEQVKAIVRQRGFPPSAARRINQLKNEYYRSQDGKAAQEKLNAQ